MSLTSVLSMGPCYSLVCGYLPVLSDQCGNGDGLLVKGALGLEVVWHDLGGLHGRAEYLGQVKVLIHRMGILVYPD